MTHKIKLLSLLCGALLLVAACDDSDVIAGDGDDDAVMAGVADQFGPGFAAIFNADRNGDPANIDDVVISFLGVNGPNFTADPVDF